MENWNQRPDLEVPFSYLEESQEAVKLLLLRPAVEAHSARVQDDANKTNAEEVVRHVNETWLTK